MKNRTRFLLASAPIFLAGLILLSISSRTTPSKPAANPSAFKINYAQLPLSFEANAGQTDRTVKYLARGAGYTIFLTENDAVIKLFAPANPSRGGQDRQGDGAVLRLTVAKANEHSEIDARDPLTGKANYFIGNDPTKWRTNIPTFSQVRYADV